MEHALARTVRMMPLQAHVSAASSHSVSAHLMYKLFCMRTVFFACVYGDIAFVRDGADSWLFRYRDQALVRLSQCLQNAVKFADVQEFSVSGNEPNGQREWDSQT